MTKHAHSLEMPTWAFALLAMVGSFLLFFVQPLIAKIVLPQLGSSPAVWNSAMVAFQLLLVVGYVYAHGLQRLAIRHQLFAHVLLLVLSALWLPISFNASEISTDSSLVLSVPWRIVVAIGPLFLLLAAQAPLLQSWLGRNGSKDGPYQLYVWSNLGSFCGLLAYPLLVDPVLPLALQKTLWAWVYLGFVAAMAVLAVALTRLEATRSELIDQFSGGRTQWPRWQQGMKWLVFATIPSALILSTTTHLTTDIMALPLLWVLPLALYLLSFVIAFSENSQIASVIVRHARLPLALFGILALSTDAFEVPVTGFASLAFLFIAGLTFHRQLFDERPKREGLTAFYIILATGGALGGLLVAIIAPLIFNWAYEYPILVVAGIAFSQQVTSERTSVLVGILLAISLGLVVTVFLDWYRPEQIWLASSFAALALLVHKRKFALPAIATCAVLAVSVLDALFLSSYGLHQRSYFGNYTIGENDAGTLRTLTHGTTTHGVQRLAGEHATEPTGYFGLKSGIGQVLN